MRNALEQAAGRPVSRETFDRINVYADQLRRENAQQNLVSRASLDHLWERHVLDSAQLVRFEPFPGASWIDIGSGAGLPGIIIACLVDGPVTLVEPRRLRAAFLDTIVQMLGLNATVEQTKGERVNGRFDVITARAVAALPDFLSMCDHLSTRKTVWALPKGRTAESELAQAKRTWQGDFRVEPSVTDADSRIIVGTQVRAGKR
jgi:16S rRNA (guanine527-N7)-methyltransferase